MNVQWKNPKSVLFTFYYMKGQRSVCKHPFKGLKVKLFSNALNVIVRNQIEGRPLSAVFNFLWYAVTAKRPVTVSCYFLKKQVTMSVKSSSTAVQGSGVVCRGCVWQPQLHQPDWPAREPLHLRLSHDAAPRLDQVHQGPPRQQGSFDHNESSHPTKQHNQGCGSKIIFCGSGSGSS